MLFNTQTELLKQYNSKRNQLRLITDIKIKNANWCYIPPPTNATLIWTQCGEVLGYKSYAETLVECDKLIVYTLNDKESVYAIATLVWQKINHSAGFSFWLNPKYKNISKDLFKEKFDSLLETWKKELGVKIIFIVVNRHQSNICESMGGYYFGRLPDMFGFGLDGMFYQWRL